MAIWHEFWTNRVARERKDRIERWEKYLGERGIDTRKHPMCTSTSLVRDRALVPKDAVVKPKPRPVTLPPGEPAPEPAPDAVRKAPPKLKTFMLLPRGVGEEPPTPICAHNPIYKKIDPAMYAPERHALPKKAGSSAASTVVSIKSLPDLHKAAEVMQIAPKAGSAVGSRLSHSVEPQSLVSMSVRSSRIDALLPKVPEMVAQQLRAALDPLQKEIADEQSRRARAEKELADLRGADR